MLFSRSFSAWPRDFTPLVSAGSAIVEPELAAVPHAVPVGQTGHLLEGPAGLHGETSLARACLPCVDSTILGHPSDNPARRPP